MNERDSISEIIDPQTGDVHVPREEWDIDVVERGLSENLGDIGGREDFIANALVRITEEDGRSWIGLTHLA